MSGIFALIPWPWRIAICATVLLLVGGSFGAGAVIGHNAGYSAAQAKGDAQISALRADYSKRAAEAAQVFSDELLAQTRTIMGINAELTKAKAEHAKTEQSLRSRIEKSTRGSNHNFSTDFVRLWNEAIGAVAVGNHAAESPHTAGTAQGAGPGSSAHSGVLRNTVTERDVLAFIAYYGKRSRDMEAQLSGLIRVVGERGTP